MFVQLTINLFVQSNTNVLGKADINDQVSDGDSALRTVRERKTSGGQPTHPVRPDQSGQTVGSAHWIPSMPAVQVQNTLWTARQFKPFGAD
ncbi:MAG: hypothetical protein JWR84_3269 [Caulobacter sp.]|nr:hypothetical protein [Caulobacter sp.]